MDGYIDTLTKTQATTLKQFRENLYDVLSPQHDDKYLLRWLRARRFNVKKSEAMLRDSLTWRTSFGTDNLLDWCPPEVFSKFYPVGLHGADKEGRPIIIGRIGRIDFIGLHRSARKSDAVKFCVQFCERINAAKKLQSEKLGKDVERFVIILDFSEFSFRNITKLAIETFSQVLTIFEANYPESIGCAFIINASFIFPIVYNIFKSFLSEDTKKKIKILGSDWQEKLLQTIDASELPVYWGGMVTDPDGDPCCPSKISTGGKIPESYYLNNLDSVDLARCTTVTVNRRSSLRLNFPVETEGSVLRWEFVTEGSDIAFGIRLQNDYTETEVVATKRVESQLVAEFGSIVCTKTGTYIVIFDNCYSWTRSKKLSYLVEVLQASCDS